jgi:hypothetical protein
MAKVGAALILGAVRDQPNSVIETKQMMLTGEHWHSTSISSIYLLMKLH